MYASFPDILSAGLYAHLAGTLLGAQLYPVETLVKHLTRQNSQWNN